MSTSQHDCCVFSFLCYFTISRWCFLLFPWLAAYRRQTDIPRVWFIWMVHTAVPPFVRTLVCLMLSFPIWLFCFSHHPLFLWNYLSLTRIYYICSCVFTWCIYLYMCFSSYSIFYMASAVQRRTDFNYELIIIDGTWTNFIMWRSYQVVTHPINLIFKIF